MKNLWFWSALFLIGSWSQAQILEGKTVENYNGFFDFYYEESKDKIYLKVTDLDSEFLYVNSLASGVGSNDIGLDRGQLGSTRLVKFTKAGNKLLLVQPNLGYRAITENQMERKSIEQAFAKSVIYGFEIVEEKDNHYIIDITDFLMEDAHGVANQLKNGNQGSYSYDKAKSALSLERTKAFPENVEFEALLTFKGDPKSRQISSVTPTASLVSVVQHHSFVKLPDDGFEKRQFDPRSGSFGFTYMDYATPVQEDMVKRFVVRHRLEKENPSAEISKAKESIIYYLDPGTPEPVRSALLEGAGWWNQAFEAIGYQDAFQVRMLPEDADPMDCRYNVIQWVHRSTRGWSYGATVTDPRTGEIIKGHVSLGSLRIRQDFLIAQALMDQPFKNSDDNYQSMLDMALARIRQLGAHEVGHTLGFSHNFAASTNGRSSVMDYPHPTLKLKSGKIDFSDAYATGIGEWDKVSVAYAYSTFETEEAEEKGLEEILSKAEDKGLRFISDADARPQSGAHAYAHLWDNGKSAVEELDDVLKIRETGIKNFSQNNIRSGKPLSNLEDVFVPLYFFHRYQTEAVVKLIGGLDYSYKVKGDDQMAVETVDANTQKKALESILKTISVEQLAIPKQKLEFFPPKAFQYGRGRESFKSQMGVAFDPMSAAATASELTLTLLLNAERANRLVQQKSLDDDQVGFKDVLDKLVQNTFGKSSNDHYFNEIQYLINEQVLLHLLKLSNDKDAFFQVKALTNAVLMELASGMLMDKGMNQSYAFQYAKMINDFNDNPENFQFNPAPKIPDGSPIGSDACFLD